jgi:hypothetical protein
MKLKTRFIPALAAISLTTASAHGATILLSENWQTTGMLGGVNGDINSATNAPLTGWIGVSFNSDNPIVANGAQGGNVLRDQGGFGGTYGSNTNAGDAVRVRSSNGTMLNEAPLTLTTLNLNAVTFSFDLKQVTANYVQVVEFSNNSAFLTTGTTSGKTNAVLRLDTIDGNTNLGLWIAKSYTLNDGVDVGFTDESYFRIRKLRPNPVGTEVGANGTFHTYDNLVITGIPEPSAALLGGLGLLALLLRRR